MVATPDRPLHKSVAEVTRFAVVSQRRVKRAPATGPKAMEVAACAMDRTTSANAPAVRTPFLLGRLRRSS